MTVGAHLFALSTSSWDCFVGPQFEIVANSFSEQSGTQVFDLMPKEAIVLAQAHYNLETMIKR